MYVIKCTVISHVSSTKNKDYYINNNYKTNIHDSPLRILETVAKCLYR